jgi:CDP-6-deoxy-D-xylo-4-hexulose-3-dehydrase
MHLKTAPKPTDLDWPLMRNNITSADLDAVVALLRQDDPVLTQSTNVLAFEYEWSKWVGVRHSVFVNSGSSANLVTLAALKALHGGGEVIVPTLTWASDIAAVLHCGFEPVFVDIDPYTLGMDNRQVIEKLSPRTRAVFLTHVLGFNALGRPLLDELERRQIPLIEDVCESHGATFEGRKLGAFGLASNFSFYYAHHLSTIEGGMVCTDDENFYETVRMLRGHGLVREMRDCARKEEYWESYPDLNPDFIFAYPAYNVRSTEINAVIGRSQLPRLDDNIERRTENLRLFLQNLHPSAYQTDFASEGSSNYAFPLILREPDEDLAKQVMTELRANGVEFRRGLSGGGNQLRQPYLRQVTPCDESANYPRVDHVHFFGFYIGNYPTLKRTKILRLCDLLNALAEQRRSPLPFHRVTGRCPPVTKRHRSAVVSHTPHTHGCSSKPNDRKHLG